MCAQISVPVSPIERSAERQPGPAATVVMRPPTDFMLPAGYRQQPVPRSHDGLSRSGFWNEPRLRMSGVSQWHVYDWARRLIVKRELRSVVDVGCGPGTKLCRLIVPVCGDVLGIDQLSSLEAARRLGNEFSFFDTDLECPERPGSRVHDLVVCADVIEHLADPDPMLGLLRALAGPEGLVLLSTPDRARRRGRTCRVCEKTEHVREWEAGEFLRLLRSRGLVPVRRRLLPATDVAIRLGVWADLLWRLGLRGTSPHGCHAVLCRVA